MNHQTPPSTPSDAAAHELWRALAPHKVVQAFVTDPEPGLTATEAASRLAK